MDEEGKVVPKLDLLPQVPQRGRQARGLCGLSANRDAHLFHLVHVATIESWESQCTFYVILKNILINNHSKSTCGGTAPQASWAACTVQGAGVSAGGRRAGSQPGCF